jgi:hypothetical protein
MEGGKSSQMKLNQRLESYGKILRDQRAQKQSMCPDPQGWALNSPSLMRFGEYPLSMINEVINAMV